MLVLTRACHVIEQLIKRTCSKHKLHIIACMCDCYCGCMCVLLLLTCGSAATACVIAAAYVIAASCTIAAHMIGYGMHDCAHLLFNPK